MRIRLLPRYDDDDDDEVTSPTPTPTTFDTSISTAIPAATDGPPFPLLGNQNHGVLPSSESSSSVAAVSTTTVYKKPPYTYYATPTSTPTTSSALPTDTTDPFSSPVNFPESSSEQNFFEKFSEGTKAAIIISIIFGFVAIVVASIWFCCGKPRRRRLKAQEAMQLHRERMDADARAAGQQPLGSSVQDLSNGRPTDADRREMEMGGVAMRDLRRAEERNPNRRNSIAPAQARGAVGRVASRVSRHISLRGGSGGIDAPPKYEEVVPPAHQRLAGGMARPGHDGPHHIEDDDGAGVVADGKMPLSEIPFEDVVLNPHTTAGSSSSSSASMTEEGGRDFNARHAAGGGDTSGHTNA